MVSCLTACDKSEKNYEDINEPEVIINGTRTCGCQENEECTCNGECKCSETNTCDCQKNETNTCGCQKEEASTCGCQKNGD